MLQHENGFEQACHSRSRFEVPDIRFDGADVKVVRPGNTLAEDLRDGRNLFSVAYLSPLFIFPSAKSSLCTVWDSYGAVSLDE